MGAAHPDNAERGFEMLEIELKVTCKKNEYDWHGEHADFMVNIELVELINAIDLNAIKNVLAQKAVQLRAEKDATETETEKDK